MGFLRLTHKPARGTVSLLTWGGLRGSLSVALALSLHGGSMHDELLAITYVIVVFSILVQGMTMPKLLNRFINKEEAANLAPVT